MEPPYVPNWFSPLALSHVSLIHRLVKWILKGTGNSSFPLNQNEQYAGGTGYSEAWGLNWRWGFILSSQHVFQIHLPYTAHLTASAVPSSSIQTSLAVTSYLDWYSFLPSLSSGKALTPEVLLSRAPNHEQWSHWSPLSLSLKPCNTFPMWKVAFLERESRETSLSLETEFKAKEPHTNELFYFLLIYQPIQNVFVIPY